MSDDDQHAHPERGLLPISVAADRLLYEIRHQGEADFLKGHPGRAREVLAIGMDRVLSHPRLLASDIPPGTTRAAVEALYDKAERLCESPIERNLLAGLLTGCWTINSAVLPSVVDDEDYADAVPHEGVAIIPQFQFGRYRFDFLVRAELGGRVVLCCLECDGRDFHEDWRRDAARDDYVRGLGIMVHRYSGTALFTQPIATANNIIDAIAEAFGLD